MNWNDIAAHIDRHITPGCNVWTGPVSTKGYPVCHYNGNTRQAVRAIWEHERGPLQSTQSLVRTCDTPLCVKLAHHELTGRAAPIAEYQYHRIKETTAVHDTFTAVHD